MADDKPPENIVPRGLALLRAHWPIDERILADGTSAAALRCPVARIILEPGGPQKSGTIWTCAFGFRPDGTPAFARIEAEPGAAVSDAALLAAMEEKEDGRPVMSTGLRLTGLQPQPADWLDLRDYWKDSIYYDDVTLRDSFAQWLRQQVGDTMSEEAAQRSAMLHLASPPLRDRLDRFDAGPAMRMLDNAHWYNGRAWLALNGGDSRGTPALALCDAWPIFADAIIRHVMRFSFPMGELGAAHVAEATVRSGKAWLWVRSVGLFFNPGEPAPAALVHAIERIRGLDIDIFSPFPNKGVTTEYETLLFVASLPEAWCPRERSDWVRVAQIASDLLGLIQHYGASASVLAQSYAGNWSDWVDRVLRAPRKRGLALLGAGMIDVGDACQAFGQQLVGPLLARAARRTAQSEDVLPSKEVDRIIRSTLFAELPVETVFARAAHWYAQSERIEAELAKLPAGTAMGDAWPAAIPDAVLRVDAQDIEIFPLTSRTMLVDEARSGIDADGVAGLNNLMAGKRHVEMCRGGHRRIVSLRTRDATGAVVRLSTAAIKFDFGRDADREAPLIVVLHRGRDAGAPPAEAVQALETYCARFRAPDPALQVDRAALAARLPHGGLDARCGYDAANDVNIEVALRLWDDMLPERLRGLSLDAFVTALGIPQLRPDGFA